MTARPTKSGGTHERPDLTTSRGHKLREFSRRHMVTNHRRQSRLRIGDLYLVAHSLILANVKDEPRPGLARLVLLGARGVTAPVVGSGALLGYSSETDPRRPCARDALLLRLLSGLIEY